MICGKDLLIEYLDEISDQRPKIQIQLVEDDAPCFDREKQVGRDSIDLRIGRKGYKIMCNLDYINTLDENINDYFYDIELTNEGYLIYPGETIIINTVERVKLTGNIIGQLTGRTRFARMGLSVCMATKFQSYSDSVVVLQLTNNNHVPLKIFPYQKLVQLIVYQVEGMPNSARGCYSNELTLKKPMIDLNEFCGMHSDEAKIIKKQRSTIEQYKTIDGNDEYLSKNEKQRIAKNNKLMYYCSKAFSGLSAICGVTISVICYFTEFNIVVIILLAILSAFCTMTSMLLEIFKEKNYIN